LALALSRKGVELSMVDLTESGCSETLRLVQIEYGKLGHSNNLRAIFIKCDVSNPGKTWYLLMLFFFWSSMHYFGSLKPFCWNKIY
jgi:hypothetical protein